MSEAQQVAEAIVNAPGITESVLVSRTGIALARLRKILYRVLAYQGTIFWIGPSLSTRRFFYRGKLPV